MKAISKAQLIDLLSYIGKDGVDNTNYGVNEFISPVKPEGWYGCEDSGCDVLQPGVYCAIWFDEDDFSDFPSLCKWIDENLTEENIVLLDNGRGWIVLICLDLL